MWHIVWYERTFVDMRKKRKKCRQIYHQMNQQSTFTIGQWVFWAQECLKRGLFQHLTITLTLLKIQITICFWKERKWYLDGGPTVNSSRTSKCCTCTYIYVVGKVTRKNDSGFSSSFALFILTTHLFRKYCLSQGKWIYNASKIWYTNITTNKSTSQHISYQTIVSTGKKQT